jgi:hypothetical protein
MFFLSVDQEIADYFEEFLAAFSKIEKRFRFIDRKGCHFSFICESGNVSQLQDELSAIALGMNFVRCLKLPCAQNESELFENRFEALVGSL